MQLTRKDFVVNASQSEMRIDHFLALLMPEVSRRKIRQILDVGGCYVNNKRMHIASRKVKTGDKVRVEFNLDALKKTRQKSFDLSDSEIIYDAHCLIAINKPPGLPSQATRDQDVMHAETCLANWLKQKGRNHEKLILLHRLDKETSGILLFATDVTVATWITDQFRNKKVKKTYWALCRGRSKDQRFNVDCYLSEIDRKTGKVSMVRSGGKQSRTDFVEREYFKSQDISWLECFPETGRSHQIRVHLELSGLPLLGDKKYGNHMVQKLRADVAEHAGFHHMLHAREIRLVPQADQETIVITADAPPHFQKLLTILE